jgi:hypothetical protein
VLSRRRNLSTSRRLGTTLRGGAAITENQQQQLTRINADLAD